MPNAQPTALDYPLHLAGDGRIARTDVDDHVRDMVRQVLFTAPGERVNHPDFGCGLLLLLFEPDSQALRAATEVLVRSSLQRWLSDVVDVELVLVYPQDSALVIEVHYTRLLDGTQFVETVTVSQPGTPAS
jgi:phage baseplate assembly protein W